MNKKFEMELDVFDYEYLDLKKVFKEELNYIVERVVMLICFSVKGVRKCVKIFVYIDEVKIWEKFLLVSGLERSKNV